MASLGSWGKRIVFTVSDKKILTASNVTHTRQARWTNHDIIAKVPKGEFLGPGQGKVTLSIILDAAHGVKPTKVLETIEKACNNGTTETLKIGKKKIGNYKWAITEYTEAYNIVYSGGQIARATVDLTFEEYR